MKNLLLLFVLFTANCFAQKTFAPIGTKWYYSLGAIDDQSGLINNQNCITIESLKDSTINGDSVRQLRITRIHPDRSIETISTEYIKQTGNSIDYYNPYSNQFIELYNFGLSAQDTLTVHQEKTRVPAGFFKDSVSFFSYVIDSVDSIRVNNTLIKRQKVVDNYSNLSNWCMTLQATLTGDDGNNYILENFGSTAYLFGYTRFFHLESMPTLLRCIEYNGNVIYKNPYWDKDCDYTILHIGMEELSFDKNKLKISPNPASNFISLPLNDFENVSIFNHLGQPVFSTDQSVSFIDVKELKSGMYFLKIKNKEGVLSSGKFYKQ